MASNSRYRRTVARGVALLGSLALLGGTALAEPLARNFVQQLRIGDTARVTCDGALLATPLPAEMRLACVAAVPPTATPPPAPTATPLPPTSTPPPAATATATPLPPSPTVSPETTPLPSTPTTVPTPMLTVAPALIEGVPICPHNNTAWHGLVEPPGSTGGAIRCTYGHTHFDDPRTLDDRFGPLPQGQTISYPWETQNENSDKHNIYKWAVYDNPTCYTAVPGLSLRAARWQYHGDANKGALTRYHSYFFQVEYCDSTDASYHGFVQFGGHMDTGILQLGAPGLEVRYPLPGDLGLPDDDACRRIHGHEAGSRPDYTWYACAGALAGELGLSFGLRNEDWGPVHRAHPNSPVEFYGGGNNQSYQERFHLFEVFSWRANSTGYVNALGVEQTGCTGISATCIPFVIRGMRVAAAQQFRSSDLQRMAPSTPASEYDVLSPVTGNSLITWPN